MTGLPTLKHREEAKRAEYRALPFEVIRREAPVVDDRS
jgi:hypothetical protein